MTYTCASDLFFLIMPADRVTPFFLLHKLVPAARPGPAADRILLLGAGAVDGGVRAARAVFAGAAGNLGGGSLLAPLRQLNSLMIKNEDGFLLPAARAFPLAAAGVNGLTEDADVIGGASGADADLLVRIRRSDGRVASRRAAVASAAGDLSRVGSVGELIVDDEHELIEPAERNFGSQPFLASDDADDEPAL